MTGTNVHRHQADVRRAATESPAAVPSPFVVAVDSREQLPWQFHGLTAGAESGHAPLHVETVVKTLCSGDYSIVGREPEIRVERKSGPDLLGTLTAGRRRFQAELDRLAGFPFSAVVIESDLSALVANPPTRMTPRSFMGSILALSMRYPTRWYFAGSRRLAEGLTYRLLERWHRDRIAESKPKRRASGGAA